MQCPVIDLTSCSWGHDADEQNGAETEEEGRKDVRKAGIRLGKKGSREGKREDCRDLQE